MSEAQQSSFAETNQVGGMGDQGGKLVPVARGKLRDSMKGFSKLAGEAHTPMREPEARNKVQLGSEAQQSSFAETNQVGGMGVMGEAHTPMREPEARND
jgi:hypothetical protein